MSTHPLSTLFSTSSSDQKFYTRLQVSNYTISFFFLLSITVERRQMLTFFITASFMIPIQLSVLYKPTSRIHLCPSLSQVMYLISSLSALSNHSIVVFFLSLYMIQIQNSFTCLNCNPLSHSTFSFTFTSSMSLLKAILVTFNINQ